VRQQGLAEKLTEELKEKLAEDLGKERWTRNAASRQPPQGPTATPAALARRKLPAA
jgi:hypothetical protein